MPTTIHDEIDELLAADLHDQLTDSERQTLHSHLVECAECRQLHKEFQNMNTTLTETFEASKPAPSFEQRTLAAFRQRVPNRGPGVIRFLVLALQSRSARVAAVAVMLLGLVQVGRLVKERTKPGGDEIAENTIITSLGIPTTDEAAQAGAAQPAEASESLAKKAEPFRAEAPVDALTSPGKPASAAVGGKLEDPASMFSGGMAGESGKDSASGRRASTIAGIGNEATHVTRAFEERAFSKLADSRSPSAAPAASPVAASATVAEADMLGVAHIDSDQTEGAKRKLIRNARTDLEVLSFQDTVEKITALAREAHGYLATSGSRKQENGKLRGEVVVKVLPDALDHFLEQLRGLGELKNQTIGTEDVSKQYFDTTARLDNARVMEQRLVEMLKKNTGKVSDLLQVEKELGRVREDIEKMQGELKFIDAQVQFATVTITLAEKEMNTPAAFLLKERARLALFTSDVEQIYNGIKALASPKVQVTQAQLDSASSGQVSGRISMLIAPEESDSTIAKIKQMGRVQTFQVQTERVARGGEGMSESARTEKDKVQVDVSITRQEEEQALQQTSLRIRSDDVDNKAQQLQTLAEKEGGKVRSSSFNKDSEGRETADLTLRLPMKNYQALMQSLGSIGKVEDVTVHREEHGDKVSDQASAPVDVAIQVYSRGNIVSEDSGIFATIRRTLGQGAGALTWSVTMIGIALAFIAPWAIALALTIYVARRIVRSRRNK
jgi:hypothetical protein